MSRPGREARRDAPQDYNGKQETHAVRNANGTGPYMLKTLRARPRAGAGRQPHWWGKADARSGNLDRGDLHGDSVRCDAPRRARLGRGRLRRRSAISGRRATQARQGVQGGARSAISARSTSASTRRAPNCSLRHQGAQPIQGRSRTSRDLPRDRRGHDRRQGAARTGARPPARTSRRWSTATFPSSRSACQYNPQAARALLKEAGYADGFGVTLDCVNIAFRAAVCQAIAACSRRSASASRSSRPRAATFFPKLTQASTQLLRIRLDAGHRSVAMLTDAVRTLDDVRAGARSTAADTRIRSSMR